MIQDFIEILILSAIQGISEFLPISSSAHLFLVSSLYDLQTSSLLIDISLHLGSLFAIVFYFRKDLFDLKHNQKLLKLIVIGSLPLIIFGYILHSSELIYLLRDIKIIAGTTLFFAIILFFSDQRKINQSISKNLNIKSDYTTVKVGYDRNASFNYECKTEFGSLKLDPKLTTVNSRKEMNETFKEGFCNSQDGKSTIQINSSFGSVRLKSNN